MDRVGHILSIVFLNHLCRPPFMLRLHLVGVACPELVEACPEPSRRGLSTKDTATARPERSVAKSKGEHSVLRNTSFRFPICPLVDAHNPSPVSSNSHAPACGSSRRTRSVVNSPNATIETWRDPVMRVGYC